jgi:Xaa-Pro aminopeptidase
MNRKAAIIYTMKGIFDNEISNYASFDWLDQLQNLNTNRLYNAICK